MNDSLPLVHVLLCEKHLGFGVPCLQSWSRHSATPSRLVIHDDGTLTTPSIERLALDLPGSQIVPRRQADELLADHLGRYPAMAAARVRLPHVIKLLDINLYPDDQAVTRYLDADVFFFKRFCDLFPGGTGEPAEAGVFLRDSSSSFGVKVTDFWPVGPLVLVRYLNSGVFWFRRRHLDFDRMEWLFRGWGPARIEQYGGWFEQTVWADAAHRAGVRLYDARQLSTATAETTSPGREVGLHYVTPARERLLELLRTPGISTAGDDGAPVKILSTPAERFGITKATVDAVKFRLHTKSRR